MTILTVTNTYSLNNLSNWSDEKWQKCPPQKEIWFAAQTNPIQHFPKFDGSQLWCRNGDSHWNEIWKAVERNPIQGFPKFDGLSESPSSFEEVSWHFVKKKTPRSPSKSEFRCMGGLINRFLPVWCPISHSIWPLLFPHQLSGGCGTRLSIRRQDPNNYSDTEMRALSKFRTQPTYASKNLIFEAVENKTHIYMW